MAEAPFEQRPYARPLVLIPARFSDSAIEAVTLAGYEGWFLALQWHLEDFADNDPMQQRIFEAFVAAA